MSSSPPPRISCGNNATHPPPSSPPSQCIMKVSGNSVPNSVSPVSTSGCKRHNIDDSTSENEPFIFNKRPRIKSGTDNMEVAVPCNDKVMDYSLNKCETSPLCERNIRTSKLEIIDNHVDKNFSVNHSITENGNCVDNISESNGKCNNIQENGHTNLENIANGDTPSVDNKNNDVLPNDKAHQSTLEYVTQLPEGCSGSNGNGLDCPNANGDALNDSHFESDGELDDDNYLDSSDGEDGEGIEFLNNDEDESCGEDDQSVVSTITVGSTCSLRSVASEAVSTIYMNEHGVAANEDGSLLYSGTPSSAPLPALSLSLFSHIPPSVNFCLYNECTEKLPPALAKLLKWRFSTITPLIVRKTVLATGYKITKKTIFWSGTWGKHMKSPCFKTVKEYQKINHYPGTFQIGRKDKLWKNFAKLQAKFGKEEFGFIPKTFVLPGDMEALKAAFDKEGVKKKWIVKPPASARGTGIQVVNKWSQMPTDTPVVVQRYISRPYLINDTKFDMRIYVLVTSFHPLILYLYQDGLVRFASVRYDKASKTLSDRYMHLTNYSVNKTSSSYTHNEDAGQCQGHKWTLRTLWGYLKARDVDTGALWSRIADLVIKTFISGESDIVARTRKNIKSRYNCYELFGFDVILDEKLRPWLLEVNISPSLHSASPLDHSVKGPLIADLLNIGSYHAPDRLDQEEQDKIIAELQLGEKVSGLTLDRRLYTRLLTSEEQIKHNQIQTTPRSQYLSTILENLTPDDVRHLTLYEDQLNRSGKFTCIFPTSDTYRYFGFLDKPRYYNRLFDAWETMYSTCRDNGIEVLENLCRDKHHLKVPTKFKMPKTVTTAPKSPLRQYSSETTETVSTTNAEVESRDTQVSPSKNGIPGTAETSSSPKKQEKCLVKKRKPIKLSVNPLKKAILGGLNNFCGVGRNDSPVCEEYEDIEELVIESSATEVMDTSSRINENHNGMAVNNIQSSGTCESKLNEDINNSSQISETKNNLTVNSVESDINRTASFTSDYPVSENNS